MIGGIRHEACACLLSGVGVDGHMGPGKHYFNYYVAHGMCNVHISGSFSIMCTWG